MNSIAVNLGHPWVEEEHDVNEAEVAYRTLEKWEVLPRKGRMKSSYTNNWAFKTFHYQVLTLR